MISKVKLSAFLTGLILSSIIVIGCSDNKATEPAVLPTSPHVYLDEFGPNVTFEAFLGSVLTALGIDATTSYAGPRSLVISVPNVGDTLGSYAGGAFTSTIARDLTQYNALTFYAKASMPATLNVVGLGNDNTGTSRFTAEVNDLPLTTTWAKYVIPIPNPERLTAERGLFYFAEGPEEGSGYDMWFDEVQFENLGTISDPQPTIPTVTTEEELGDTLTFGNGTVDYDVDGDTVTVSAMSGYFTFFSSDTNVVKVAGNGVITAVGLGTAELTANLGTVPASGAISVTVVPPTPEPTEPAPTPTVPAGDVISLYSNAYTDVPVTTWSAEWDFADVFDDMVGTDDVKRYENLIYAGIEFASPTLDASAMTHFHIDVWTPIAVSSATEFKIKLVDFGDDGLYQGGDDTEHELVFTESTVPALTSESWISFDIPLAAFTGLTTTSHMAQLIISGTQLPVVYVDNIYFYDAGNPTKPLLPAPVPDQPSANVISLYSDAYDDVPVDTWSAVWDDADVIDDMVGTDNVKKYTSLNVAGIEFILTTIDASSMENLHLDVWTPDPTEPPAQFRIKLVDFGGDGLPGGGDDVEHELTFDRTSTPSLVTANWISFDIPLSDFTNLTATGHLAQLIISGSPNTVFVDNIYFYTEGPQAPSLPAPTPSVPEVDVISLFSDAYTDVPVDTWSAPWDSANVEDFLVGSDNNKKYTRFTTEFFAGIEFTDPTIDATTMSHFHIDVWTPDATDGSSVFKVKLRDFGANGVWDAAGDDVEHELTFDGTVMSTGTWVSLDIPLTDFVGLTTRGHLGQLIISGALNTIYVDNIYFYDAHLATSPTTSAPAPTVDEADVISLFSDLYTNWPVNTWSSPWGSAVVTDFALGADNLKLYTELGVAYIDFRSNTINATAMTGFHMDLWTPDPTAAPSTFKVRLVDFGADGALGGGDDVNHELIFDETVMNTRDWVSIDVPLSAFINLVTREHLGQMVISGDPNTVYVDNIYLYK